MRLFGVDAVCVHICAVSDVGVFHVFGCACDMMCAIVHLVVVCVYDCCARVCARVCICVSRLRFI